MSEDKSTTSDEQQAATDTPQDAQEPPEVVEVGSTERAEPAGPVEDDPREGREAARYRRRLRETEAERDTLAARVEALQRAAVEREASGALARPEALWAAGVDLAGLLTDEGTVDAAKVAQAVEDARDRLGLAPAVRTPRADPTQGGRGGIEVAPRFEDAFTPRD